MQILFLTNFSEACFQALPSLAEWVDRDNARLTLLHVHGDGPAREASAKLNSFFAEADKYLKCRRIVLPGDPLETIANYCARERPDLVFAPASENAEFPRFFHRSLRARLISEGGVKLWTRGRLAAPRTAPKNVVYAITGHANWTAEAMTAASLASRYNANLHFVHLATWPEVHEGTLASDLNFDIPRVHAEELRWLASKLNVQPIIHNAIGNGPPDLIRILRSCNADLAFLGESHAIRRNLFGLAIHPELDRLDCEVVCFPRRPVAEALQPMRLLAQPAI